MICRKGETEKIHFRADRFYAVGGQWRFMTREGREMGPYVNKREAESELALYIEFADTPFAMVECEKLKTDDDIWGQSFAR